MAFKVWYYCLEFPLLVLIQKLKSIFIKLFSCKCSGNVQQHFIYCKNSLYLLSNIHFDIFYQNRLEQMLTGFLPDHILYWHISHEIKNTHSYQYLPFFFFFLFSFRWFVLLGNLCVTTDKTRQRRQSSSEQHDRGCCIDEVNDLNHNHHMGFHDYPSSESIKKSDAQCIYNNINTPFLPSKRSV